MFLGQVVNNFISTTNSVPTFGSVDRCVITDNMASCSDSVSGSHTNSLSNRSDSHAGSEFEPNEIKGYLMKRARLTRKWKRVYFVLKNCDLLYYSNPEVCFSSHDPHWMFSAIERFLCFYWSHVMLILARWIVCDDCVSVVYSCHLWYKVNLRKWTPHITCSCIHWFSWQDVIIESWHGEICFHVVFPVPLVSNSFVAIVWVWFLVLFHLCN